jgi:hypothetical protein
MAAIIENERVGSTATPAAGSPRRAPTVAIRALPWLLVLGGLVAALMWTGTPIVDVARYGAYWALCLLLPGTLVHRALRGSRGNLPEDLGYGAVTGLVLELAGWALAAFAGVAGWRWVWPLAVVVAFVAVPGLRRHWRIAEPRPLPLRWSWAIAVVMILVIGWAALQWATIPLPPLAHTYYPDLYYHLSLVHELTRSAPFEVPQMVGEPLRYHYLGNAHMASASMITGVEPPIVLLRLWAGPVMLAGVLVTAALARELTGRTWAGPVAAAVTFGGHALALGRPIGAPGLPISLNSPSQTYLVPLLLTLTAICCDLVRGRRLGGAWALLPALGLACAGAKASGLPVLVAGMTVAVLVASLQRRAVAWRAVTGLAVVTTAMVVGALAFVGGGAGTLRLDPMGIAVYLEPYLKTWRADNTVTGTLAALRFEAVLLGWFLAAQLPRLVGLSGLARRRMRADPAAWLLAGGAVAGAAAMWTFGHPSVAQSYFWLAAVPIGTVLTVWLVADAAPRSRAAGLVAGGLAGGFAAAWLLWYAWPAVEPAPTFRAWRDALAAPMLRGAAVAAVLVVGWLVVRRLDGRLPGRGLAVGVAALLGASLAGGLEGSRPMIESAVRGNLPAAPVQDRNLVTEAEMRAALWIEEHTEADAVIATNVHCRPVQTVPRCDSWAFWVTGLGGRRAVIESWAYVDEVVAANGRDGLGYRRQPAPDPARYELNERVFAEPTAEDLVALRTRYGVRWLLGDERASPVSPALAGLARVRYADGPVTVYELEEG